LIWLGARDGCKMEKKSKDRSVNWGGRRSVDEVGFPRTLAGVIGRVGKMLKARQEKDREHNLGLRWDQQHVLSTL